jgi:hypothetical protein
VLFCRNNALFVWKNVLFLLINAFFWCNNALFFWNNGLFGEIMCCFGDIMSWFVQMNVLLGEIMCCFVEIMCCFVEMVCSFVEIMRCSVEIMCCFSDIIRCSVEIMCCFSDIVITLNKASIDYVFLISTKGCCATLYSVFTGSCRYDFFLQYSSEKCKTHHTINRFSKSSIYNLLSIWISGTKNTTIAAECCKTIITIEYPFLREIMHN